LFSIARATFSSGVLLLGFSDGSSHTLISLLSATHDHFSPNPLQ
jgi:hypothetical protein